jgi:hypothetical protein
VHDNLHKFIDDTVLRSGGEDRHAPAIDLQSIRVHDSLHKFIDDTVIRSGGEDRHAPANALQPLQVPHGAIRSLPHR